MIAIACALAIVATAIAGALQAQVSPPSGNIYGMAWDSLHGVPLKGAFIGIEGSGRTTVSDSLGRFVFVGVSQGVHTYVLMHPTLDSVGISGRRLFKAHSAGDDTILIALPAIATIWRLACSSEYVADGTGVLFGSVRDGSDRTPIKAAKVRVSWTTFDRDASGHLRPRVWSGVATTDGSGSYVICGVAQEPDVQFAVIQDSTVTIELLLDGDRSPIYRLDVSIPALGVKALRGTIALTVTDTDGVAIRGAGVASQDGASDARRVAGRLILSQMPAGTNQVRVRALGFAPTTAILDVSAKDTTNATIRLHRLSSLSEVVIHGRRSARQLMVDEIAERRRGGLGKFMDTLTVSHYRTLTNALSMMVRPNFCALYIDGLLTPQSELRFRDPEDVGVIEVEPAMALPGYFRGRSCGGFASVVLIWTKVGFP